jgi:ribose-phosphate pyrophosphokinase
MGMSQGVAGRKVILGDDNVFTGATLLSTAKELKQAGAKSIRVGLTHHLYVPGVQEKLEQSEINEIVVTDTIGGKDKSKVKSQKSKLRVLSVAPLIVDELAK